MNRENQIARNLGLILVSTLVGTVGASCNTPPALTADAPTDTATFVPPTSTETEVIFATETPTSTPENTTTPEVSYNCPVNPDNPNMSEITSLKELPKLAEWALKQPGANGKISANPAKLDYVYEVLRSDGTGSLNAQLADDLGWEAKHTLFLGSCKISPALFGFPEKDMGRLLITVIQDKNDRRAVQFTFASGHYATRMFDEFQFTDQERNSILAVDDIGTARDYELIASGATPGSSADLRPMRDGETFFTSQGTSRAEVDSLFEEIAATDIFSDAVIQKLHSTVFFTATGWNMRK